MLSKIVVSDEMKILDVGCGVDGRSFSDYVPRNWEITGVDIEPPERVHHKHPRFEYVHQDAQDLSRFRTNEFDLCVCIGMMEHITDESTFRRIASELIRVAKQYIVVVPFKYCWIEPHYGFPFFPLLPYSVKVAVVKALNLSDLRNSVTKDPQYINRHYRWLSNSEYLERFPGSRVFLFPTFEMIAIVKTL